MSSGEATMLYRCPGVNRGPHGRTYDWVAATDQADIDLKIKDGWFLTLVEAVESFELGQPAADPTELLNNMTPVERAKAADAAMALAAERSLAANRDRAEAEAASVAADKVFAEAAAAAANAETVRVSATEGAAATAAAKKAALEKSQAASKAFATSKLRATAADKTLADAAAKVLASDSLLKDATDKALAQAAATEKALADAAGKAGKKKKEDPAPAATFEAVVAALTVLRDTVDAKAVTAVLKKYGVTVAPDLVEGQYADVIAAAGAAAKKG